jgi:NAD(P)-dependent dehydrogenase (short-subunit alcohol dehydrogenase family)
MQFDGKVALITGADSGIGRAAAKLFAAKGAKVAALDLDEAKIRAVAAAIEQAGGEAISLAADISVPRDVERAMGVVEETWGRLDIVFANAGINGVWAPLDELTPEEWRRTMDVNLTGTFLTMKYALPLLKMRGGSVVITASVNGNRIFSNTGATAYSCSKAGLVALAKMTALELASDRIRVNVVCPGAITTSIGENSEQRDLDEVKVPVEYPEGSIPLTGGKPGSPEQVARLVAFLASDDADLITGTEVYIDGAESLVQG